MKTIPATELSTLKDSDLVWCTNDSMKINSVHPPQRAIEVIPTSVSFLNLGEEETVYKVFDTVTEIDEDYAAMLSGNAEVIVQFGISPNQIFYNVAYVYDYFDKNTHSFLCDGMYVFI